MQGQSDDDEPLATVDVLSGMERLVHRLCDFLSAVDQSKSCNVGRFHLCGRAKVDHDELIH